MVYLKSLIAEGLFSYGATADSESDNVALLSKSAVIIGPNDSGKTNLFRILELFVQSLLSSRRLEKDDVFPDATQPRLEVRFSLSEKEVQVIIDFLSFSRERSQNPPSEKIVHYDFKNRLSLAKLLQDVRCEITWQLDSSLRMEPLAELEFEKIGLKFLAANPYSATFVGTKFHPETGTRGFDPALRVKFIEFLDSIADKDESSAKALIEDFFGSNESDLAIENLMGSYTQSLADDKRRNLASIFEFMGIGIQDGRDISFLRLMGSILNDKLFFTTGGRILGSSNSRILGDFEESTSARIAPQLPSLKPAPKLKPDGSNLAQFLFDLHLSEDQINRAKFKHIQNQFSAILKSRMTFDLIQHEEKQFPIPGVNETPVVTTREYPTIMVINHELDKQFSLDNVGYGVSELLFLLSVCIGVNDSVLLLDEPSSNMHPPLMKALMKKLGEGTNQLIMITHSPELAHYEIFGRGADLVYVRKDEKRSTIKCLSNGERMLGLNRSSLYSEIDSRIFFGRSIILCEGYADEIFLDEMARDLALDLDGEGVVIVNTRGMGDFAKYCLLMNYFGIKYVIFADTDTTPGSLLGRKASKYTYSADETFAIIGENEEGNPRVFFLRGDLEKSLTEVDSDAYQRAMSEVARNDGKKDSKPLIAKEFLERQVSKEKRAELSTLIRPIFQRAMND